MTFSTLLCDSFMIKTSANVFPSFYFFAVCLLLSFGAVVFAEYINVAGEEEEDDKSQNTFY